MDDKNELIAGPSSKDKDKTSEDEPEEKEKPAKPTKSEKNEQSNNKFAVIPHLYTRFVKSVENALNQITNEPTPKTKLSSFDLKGIAKYIQAKNVRNIIFLVGAGISTSAGVPDFRSPGSGIYDKYRNYGLSDPQILFEMDFFRRDPKPFYELCREIFPESLKPTPMHYFMNLLDKKGYLRRIYTQNIDCLEHISGIPSAKVVAAHGSYESSICLSCKKKFSMQWLREFLRQTEKPFPVCTCRGLIKPEITFFGEDLPSRFFTAAVSDFPRCDLLIIVGTSLVVQPFASTIHEVNEEVPRLLINLEPVGKVSKRERALGGEGLEYNEKGNIRDVFWQGKSDDGAWKLAELLGLKEELDAMIKLGWKQIDEKMSALEVNSCDSKLSESSSTNLSK